MDSASVNRAKGRKSPTGNLDGKVALVTGANSGIGKETALRLAQIGAEVIMLCRNPLRGKPALEEIRKKSGSLNVDLSICDLASQDSIKSFAGEFSQTHSRLHILINNAGIYHRRQVFSNEGIEMQFAVNYLGPFLLTNLLLDLLRNSAPARVINVSSNSHRSGKLDFGTPQGLTKSGPAAYSRSKLALVLFTYGLAERVDGSGLTVNAVDPGDVSTNIARGLVRLTWMITKPFWMISRLSTVEGAEPILRLVSGPEHANTNGKYFRRYKEVESAKRSYDASLAKHLWDISVKLTKLESHSQPTR